MRTELGRNDDGTRRYAHEMMLAATQCGVMDKEAPLRCSPVALRGWERLKVGGRRAGRSRGA